MNTLRYIQWWHHQGLSMPIHEKKGSKLYLEQDFQKCKQRDIRLINCVVKYT